MLKETEHSSIYRISFEARFQERDKNELESWINSFVGERGFIAKIKGEAGKPLSERREALKQYMREQRSLIENFAEIDKEIIPGILEEEGFIVIRTDNNTNAGLGMAVGITGIQGKREDYGKVNFGADVNTRGFEPIAERIFEDLLPKNYRNSRINAPLDEMTGDFSVRGMFGWYSALEKIRVVGEATQDYREIMIKSIGKIRGLLVSRRLNIFE